MPTIEIAIPGTPAADEIVRAYLFDVASSYYGRPITAEELDETMVEEPYDDLAGSTGLLLVAIESGRPVACAGARYLERAAELTKVFTLPAHRGSGLGTRLIGQHAELARSRGFRTLRLDTRSDLVEACALYERLGFAQVPAFNNSPYSDRWYAKAI